MYDDRSSVQDVAQYLDKEAKKNNLFFKEMWIDWIRLCYCMFQYTDDKTIDKDRQRRIEEQEQMKIVYEWTANKRWNRNWKPIMGKINLCKTNVWDYKARAREHRKKEAEEWLPERSPKQFL